MLEEWREVRGYEGLYEVSDMGRVRSLDRVVHLSENSVRPACDSLRKGRILKPEKDTRGGYMIVNLSKDGSVKKKKIHRLVMEAFVGECPEGYQVNHLDENPENNALLNLEYVTCKENINYGSRTEKVMRKISKPVVQMLDGKVIAEYPSLSEAARQVEKAWDIQISRCCRGLIKTCAGYQWEYKEAYYG